MLGVFSNWDSCLLALLGWLLMGCAVRILYLGLLAISTGLSLLFFFFFLQQPHISVVNSLFEVGGERGLRLMQ